MNEKDELNEGRINSKNEKIFAADNNFEGGHKKRFGCWFAQKRVSSAVLGTDTYATTEQKINLTWPKS